LALLLLFAPACDSAGGESDGGGRDAGIGDTGRPDRPGGSDAMGPSACRLIWGQPMVVSDEDAGTVLLPEIGYAVAVEGGRVHAVWMSASPTGDSVLYRRSDDGGETWKPSQVLSSRAEQGPTSPVIGVAGSDVHVAWRDTLDSTEGAIYARSSIDLGESWGPTALLSTAGVRSAAPWVAVRGETVFVAFEYYDLGPGNTRIRRSRDRGATWDPPIDATREAIAKGGGGCPTLTTGPGQRLDLVHCSLKDAVEAPSYNWELYHRISTDNGSTWTEPPVRLTDDRIGDSRFPTSARRGQSLHVVWWDDRDDTKYPHQGYPPIEPEPDHNFEIYYKRSGDDGASWGADVRLTWAEGVGRGPTVAVVGQLVYVVWQDSRDGNEEIYFKCSSDDGLSFGEDVRLTSSPGVSKSPKVAVDGQGNAYLLWSDQPDRRNEVIFMKGTVAASRGI